ncbi:MAG TPA: S41 family peptidase [Methylomirabilota bacterium]|nr:S41 family peptidase [Methylomirabilota bacterium]
MDLKRWTAGGALVLVLTGGAAAGAEELPSALQEVYSLLRTNLSQLSEKELERAAIDGLIQQLGPRVQWLGDHDSAPNESKHPAVSSGVFEGAYARLRVHEVRAGLEQDLARAYERHASTGKIKGLVLDLRFAHGTDYAAALAAANWFIASEQPLIDWGEGLKKSTAREKALGLPVITLVNRRTSGAAEALAAMLREAEIGLIIGTNTAGTAAIGRDFTLRDGRRLRVYGHPVRLADGQPLPASGLKADLELTVNESDERAFLEDAFRDPAPPAQASSAAADPAAGARASRRRVNEAELVRQQREGAEPGPASTPARPVVPEPPQIVDPALARAVDLLKGLAIVHQYRD